MTKLLSALKRTLGASPDGEPTVHFHQGTHAAFPEVCHEGACERPRLA